MIQKIWSIFHFTQHSFSYLVRKSWCNTKTDKKWKRETKLSLLLPLYVTFFASSFLFPACTLKLRRTDYSYLKLVSAIFIKFLFFHQITACQKLRKMFFISLKKISLLSRYSHFCNFFPSFLHFPDSKR